MAEPQQAEPRGAGDGTMVRIGQAIMLHRGGDREEARNRFALLWREAEESGHLFHRCAIAHHMADTQDDPLDELEWDLRALAAADALTGESDALTKEADARPSESGASPEELARWGEHARAVRSLYPALYLSLASDHAKLGDRIAARHELGRARGLLGALGDDAYSTGVRAAFARLEERLRNSRAG